MRREIYRQAPVFLLMFIFTTFKVFAASSTILTTKQNSTKNFIEMISGFSSNTYQTNGFVDNTKSSNINSWNRINIKLNKVDTVKLDMVVNKDLQGEDEWDLNDPYIGYKRSSIIKTDSIKIGAEVRVGVATSKISTLIQKKIGYINLVPSLSLTNGIYSLGIITIVTRNFYEFKQDINGNVNKEWALTAIMGNTFSVTDKIDISVSLIYGQSKYFDGVDTADRFAHLEEVSYAFNTSLSIALGHSIGGRLVDYQSGTDEKFELYDSKTSQFYSNITYSF
jgi:hypothetical protein